MTIHRHRHTDHNTRQCSSRWLVLVPTTLLCLGAFYPLGCGSDDSSPAPTATGGGAGQAGTGGGVGPDGGSGGVGGSGGNALEAGLEAAVDSPVTPPADVTVADVIAEESGSTPYDAPPGDTCQNTSFWFEPSPPTGTFKVFHGQNNGISCSGLVVTCGGVPTEYYTNIEITQNCGPKGYSIYSYCWSATVTNCSAGPAKVEFFQGALTPCDTTKKTIQSSCDFVVK